MTGRKTVLVVDDSGVDRRLLEKTFETDYYVLSAENGEEALAVLDRTGMQVSAIILDLWMPVMDGYTFLEHIKEMPEHCGIPVIVATGQGNAEEEKKSLQMGAWDFISKPYDADILRFRLQNAIVRSQVSAFKQLKYIAEHDVLTGIYNKSRFLEEVKTVLAENPDKTYVLARFDLEHFQLINSFFGMETGDQLLQYIADWFVKLIVEPDLGRVGRIEADVFAFCIPYEGELEFARFVTGCKDFLKDFPLDYNIAPTIGAYLIEDAEEDITSMLDKASLAAKKVKGNYIQDYAFYTPELSKALEREQRITNEMVNALEQRQFQVYLQPKYNLQTNLPVGAEALVRWFHPERGIISPGIFIPVFERNGFIIKLDRYVWEEVCRLLRKWLDEGKSPAPISVNVSRVNIYNPGFIESIRGLAEKYRIPYHLLELEITESAYTENPGVMRETIKTLQNQGFKILMDDFGSAYSSLNILKNIEMNVLKIDMKFMEEAETPGRSQNILASIVRMAKWLHLPVVAEGVEKRQQVDFLRGIGCEYVQGYYFAKPMPIEDYEKLEQSGEAFIEEPEEQQNDMAQWIQGEELEMLLSSVMQPLAVYEYTEYGHVDVIRVNQAFYDMFGYEDRSMHEGGPEAVVKESYRKGLIAAFSEVARKQDSAEYEYERETVAGGSIWVRMKIKYIAQVSDRHIIFGTLVDITAEKRNGQELERYRNSFSDHLNQKLLIVEDRETNRDILKEMFCSEFTVLEAENGRQALDIMAEQRYDVDIILLDLEMPVMNGVEFLKIRSQTPELLMIPVVVITADEREQQQEDMFALGVSDYILKPFVREAAVRRVMNALESSRRIYEMGREQFSGE